MSTPTPASASDLDARWGHGRVWWRIWPLIWIASIAYPAWVRASSGHLGDVLVGLAAVTSAIVLGLGSVRGSGRSRLGVDSADRTGVLLVAAGGALALPCLWLMGINASSLAFFFVVAVALTWEFRPAVVVTALATAALFAVDGRGRWDQTHWMALGLLASGVGAAFGRRANIRGRDAKLATEYAHQMEINDERNRMARDLHDILGHSLTVITLKTELAGKLMDVDPAAAKQELAEAQSLSRSALADVRATVNNYRELSLAGELARANNTLAAAGVRADLPLTVDVVAPELRELFAWAVREGVTNVVRHADASHCRVVLGPSSMAVVDDGVGVHGTSDGHGISGLRERCAASGVDVELRPGPRGVGTELSVRARDLANPVPEPVEGTPTRGDA